MYLRMYVCRWNDAIFCKYKTLKCSHTKLVLGIFHCQVWFKEHLSYILVEFYWTYWNKLLTKIVRDKKNKAKIGKTYYYKLLMIEIPSVKNDISSSMQLWLEQQRRGFSLIVTFICSEFRRQLGWVVNCVEFRARMGS